MAKAIFVGGTLGTAAGVIGNLATFGVLKLKGVTVLGTGTMTFGGAQLWMSDVSFSPGLTVGASIFVRASNTTITGALTADVALRDLLFDPHCTVGAGSVNIGVPTSAAHIVGDTHKNMIPAEAGGGGSKYVIEGWVCTVAANPGTFLQKRTLTGN